MFEKLKKMRINEWNDINLKNWKNLNIIIKWLINWFKNDLKL